jgi:hypothetical protein
VYVSERPWAAAEDVLKGALAAFVSSASSSWVNVNVNPIVAPP